MDQRLKNYKWRWIQWEIWKSEFNWASNLHLQLTISSYFQMFLLMRTKLLQKQLVICKKMEQKFTTVHDFVSFQDKKYQFWLLQFPNILISRRIAYCYIWPVFARNLIIYALVNWLHSLQYINQNDISRHAQINGNFNAKSDNSKQIDEKGHIVHINSN